MKEIRLVKTFDKKSSCKGTWRPYSKANYEELKAWVEMYNANANGKNLWRIEYR